jgi:hypothetical protein
VHFRQEEVLKPREDTEETEGVVPEVVLLLAQQLISLMVAPVLEAMEAVVVVVQELVLMLWYGL